MKKLFSAEQIRSWDQYTINHEPIASVDLMKRAAQQCTLWLTQHFPELSTSFSILCGNGNNGGDGLVISSMLNKLGYPTLTYILNKEQRSADNQTVLNELQRDYPNTLRLISDAEHLSIPESHIIIDALLGSGLNASPMGIEKEIILKLHTLTNTKIAIDIPSGLYSAEPQNDRLVVHANHTLTFQQIKFQFFFPESGKYCGNIHVLNIGLHPDFEHHHSSNQYIIDGNGITNLYKPRDAFSNKGNYGKCLLIVGSKGMMGAALLSTKACLRSGIGLLHVAVPNSETAILQQEAPEAITQTVDQVLRDAALDSYATIGIGCGLGITSESVEWVDEVLRQYRKPMVIDADALNIISNHKNWLARIPEGSVLTPHPKEFDRLFGSSINAFERNQLQCNRSVQYKCYIVLKGRYTSISTPEGFCYFNTTGNAGMAKGGSGDVLTGIISGLYGQYQDMLKACLMGVYLHGLAGDISAKNISEESMLPSDIILNLGEAFKSISQSNNEFLSNSTPIQSVPRAY